jgi:PAS domain S-box-containing protein
MNDLHHPRRTPTRTTGATGCWSSDHRLRDLHAGSGRRGDELEPGAERFKGYVADEIVGQHFSVFYTEEDRAAGAPAKALAIAAQEGRFEREGWRVRKDGTRFWAHVVIDPIKGDGGALIGFAKITRDLTERREAEAALRQSEQQFRLLVQGVADYAIYMLDPSGKCLELEPRGGAHQGLRSG